MNPNYEQLKKKALSAFRELAHDCPEYSDAQMLVGSADTSVSLKRNKIHKSIDLEWIETLEKAIPYIDLIVRNPSVAIEDVDEILPVELSRHITDKSIKHLAQHTNLILSVDGDEVTPSKILNVYHDETLLTYENKFVNTLIVRLAAFVDKRYQTLVGGYGTEQNFRFDYLTEFEHFTSTDAGRNSARIRLSIELTSPLNQEASESDIEVNARYTEAVERLKKINRAIMSFLASPFARTIGRNYIRPPVIRTNAILKNKNMKECLKLWEFIESFDKVGYSFVGDEYREMPSDEFVGGMHSPVALEYATFFSGVIKHPEDIRLLSEQPLFETFPEFDEELSELEMDDYLVYDSEYKKTVPVSRLMNNRKKLSEDEKRIRLAIIVALKADELLNAEQLAKEAEARRLERERRAAEEAERKRLAEEEAERQRLAEEERLREEEEKRKATPPVEVLYRRSFMSRCIQTDDLIKSFYSEIKNELLSYKGVKARLSWSKESFRRGRQPVATIDIKGKTLYLRLALNPADYVDTKYKFTDMSQKRGGEDYPMLLKVKSERAKRYAIELITELMAKLELKRIDREPENFVLPYEENEPLIERGLIRVVTKSGQALQDDAQTVKGQLPEFEHKTPETPAETEQNTDIQTVQDTETDEIGVADVTEETGAESEESIALAETQTETEPVPESDSDELSAMAIETPLGPVEVLYRRSFMSRCIQTDDLIKSFYSEIKNKLLSYKGVKARLSWSKESFRRGRQPVATIDIKGKTLYLRLALNPADYVDTKYKFTDMSQKRGGEDYPMLLKVKSERAKRYAIELITELMAKLELKPIDREPENFVLPYEENEPLIERGLIRVVTKSGQALQDDAQTVKGQLPEFEHKTPETLAENAESTDSQEQPAEGMTESETLQDTLPVLEEIEEQEPEVPAEGITESEILQDTLPVLEETQEQEPEVPAENPENADSQEQSAEGMTATEILQDTLPILEKIQEQEAEMPAEPAENADSQEQSAEGITATETLQDTLSVLEETQEQEPEMPAENAENADSQEQSAEGITAAETLQDTLPVLEELEEQEPEVPAENAESTDSQEQSAEGITATETAQDTLPLLEETQEQEPDMPAENPENADSQELPAEEKAEVQTEAELPMEETRPVLSFDTVQTLLGPVEIFYRTSFASRCIQAHNSAKGTYSEIKNELLSYCDVRARMGWEVETFKCNGIPIATIDIKGKTLYLRLALNPGEYEDAKFEFKDMVEKRGVADYPTLFKVRGRRTKLYAFALIAAVMEKYGIRRIDRIPENYVLPYESNAPLIERGLIRLVARNGEALAEDTAVIDTGWPVFAFDAPEDDPE